jgi:hypothetical protein
VPAGLLTVRADLYDANGSVVRTRTIEVQISQLVVSVVPTSLVGLAGHEYASRLVATVTDGGVPVAGVPVRFRFPTTPPNATFIGLTPADDQTVITDAQGVATSPRIMAGAVVGVFDATVSAPGAASVTVPMASQYGLTAFGSPVNESKTNNLSPTNTLPMKTTALLADGTKLSDAAAAALVQSGQVQVRWREVGTTTWFTKTGLVVYDPGKDLFQADMKPVNVGWVKGKTYTVNLRILVAAPADGQAAESALQSDFDLGGRTITILVK